MHLRDWMQLLEASVVKASISDNPKKNPIIAAEDAVILWGDERIATTCEMRLMIDKEADLVASHIYKGHDVSVKFADKEELIVCNTCNLILRRTLVSK